MGWRREQLQFFLPYGRAKVIPIFAQAGVLALEEFGKGVFKTQALLVRLCAMSNGQLAAARYSLQEFSPQVGLEPTTLRLRFIQSFRFGADYLINFLNFKSCRVLVGFYWSGLLNP